MTIPVEALFWDDIIQINTTPDVSNNDIIIIQTCNKSINETITLM